MGPETQQALAALTSKTEQQEINRSALQISSSQHLLSLPKVPIPAFNDCYLK